MRSRCPRRTSPWRSRQRCSRYSLNASRARKARQRDHEVAPRPAHQTLHRPLVVALAGATVPVPDEVVREESAEQPRAPARPVTLDPRHQAPVVVVENRQRDRAEERERVHVPVDPCLGRRRRVCPNVRCVAVRQVEGEEMDFLLDPTNERPRFAKIGLRVPRRMNQRHVHLPTPAMILREHGPSRSCTRR